jgi:hypothetical protein
MFIGKTKRATLLEGLAASFSLSAAMMATMTSPALAAGPATPPGGWAAGSIAVDGRVYPTTVEQQAAIASKEARVHQVMTALTSGGAVSPMTPGPVGSVSTYYRNQVKNIYCGPAAIQVVSNYAWGIYSSSQSTNKYTQQYISDTWTHTDLNQSTGPSTVAYGLDGAMGTHHPSGFTYAAYQVTSGADWHGRLVTDIATYAMPMTPGVAPHDPGVLDYLPSWPTAHTAGHWVTAYGYYMAVWDGTRNPGVSYDDGSAAYGGGSGSYSTSSYVIYQTIMKGNVSHTPGWIVW